MKILVLNSGSSSIKYQLLDVESENQTTLLAKGLVERIGLPEGKLIHKPEGKDKFELVQPIADHTVGIKLVFDALVDETHGVIADINEVKAAGHRIVHGGEYFKDSAIIDEQAKIEIKNLFELAPLHNPAGLKGIEAITELLPNIPQVGVFDTSFHSSMPQENYMYALPYKYYDEMRIRRYGFHGTSHKYVYKKGCEMFGLNPQTAKVITCHLGNGGSITAIKGGKSMITSMGFTPVDGVIMGTRTGEIDPSALLYIMEREGADAARISNIINKESGLAGVSEISSDMRDIVAAEKDGSQRARLLMDMFTSRLRRFIGAYYAELGGCDLIVFTGGIGENEEFVRHESLIGLECMGIEFDNDINYSIKKGTDAEVTKPESRVKVAVICTDEESVIDTDTYRLVSNL